MEKIKQAFCPSCGKEVSFHIEIATETVAVRGVKLRVPVMRCTCEECHEELDVPSVSEENLRVAYEAYKKKMGLMTGDEIKELREKYHISASALSQLIGAGEKTITRYENGAIQDTIYDTILKLITVPQIYEELLEMNTKTIEKQIFEKSYTALRKTVAQQFSPINASSLKPIRLFTKDAFDDQDKNWGEAILISVCPDLPESKESEKPLPVYAQFTSKKGETIYGE